MAENKKSVLLYCDIIHVVDKLTDEQAGRLFKHYLAYINDRNPVTNDIVIELIFEPIKQNLKRDLKKWDEIREKRSLAGKTSAEIKKQNQHMLTHVNTCQQSSTNSTVNVNVNDNVNVNVNDNVNVSDINTKEKKKYIKKKNTVISYPSLEEVKSYFRENGYKEQAGEKMYMSYSVNDWTDSRGNKVKNWKQKAINVWFTEENRFNNIVKLCI